MSSISRVLLYARTLRHLRKEQWLYRPLRAIQRRLPIVVKATESARAERLVTDLERVVSGWGPSNQESYLAAAAAVMRAEFNFLNHREVIPNVDWRRRYVSHLWSYNLHYFDYALDLAWAFRSTRDEGYRDRFIELALDWIEQCPQGQADGWEPYAISLRAVNWIYALLLFEDALDADVRDRIEKSVAEQIEFLSRRLEYHILANHLQKNLKTLVVGGLYFTGLSAQRWLRKGLRFLWRELFEQVLPDGVHYERSPMYHAIALGDFLEVVDLLRAAGEPIPRSVEERVQRLVAAFGVVCRPDGMLHLFNDSAAGIAPDRAWLDRLARNLFGAGVPTAERAISLPHAGYFGYADPRSGNRLLIDCGEPGPSYQPGHAHCDLLSFELDLAGRQVVVDSGVHGYDGDPFREYVRSTRAHNTVSIDGSEQSEIWATFRMARRARVLSAKCSKSSNGIRFEGAYRPYHDRSAVHRREIGMEGTSLEVVDSISGAPAARLHSYIHLHPDFEVVRSGSGFTARAGTFAITIEPFGIDRASVVRGEKEPTQGWYCPEFGRAFPAPVLELVVDRNEGREFGYRISPLSG